MLLQVDLLAFGFRAGDVECGAGGLLAKEARLGYRVGVIDLYRGDVPDSGSGDDWLREAQAAAAVLGLSWREKPEQLEAGKPGGDELSFVVKIIRETRPRLVLVPWPDDGGPERLQVDFISRACHAAGQKKYLPELRPYTPSGVIYYFTGRAMEPSLIVDVTPVYEVKRSSMATYRQRFAVRASDYTGGTARLSLVEARDRYFGSLIGKSFGEGYRTQGPLAVADPLYFWVSQGTVVCPAKADMFSRR
jgi:bacillithiol biosynthesis deacetylase BshB1